MGKKYIQGYDAKNKMEKRFRNSGLGRFFRRAEWAWLRWLIFKIFVFTALACAVLYFAWTKTDLFDKYKKPIWSERSSKEMSWYDAESYCESLSENGSNDWRLPTIDELRSQINCPQTEEGGECQISEENGKLSENNWTDACKGCNRGRRSKLGDNGWFWSSSSYSSSNDKAWSVYFGSGLLQNTKTDNKNYVRCVRYAGKIF